MAITGVTINGKHSIRDYNMYLTTVPQLDPPNAKTVYVSIPGANGKLDLTESVTGEISYENRTLRMEFAIRAKDQQRPSIMSRINGDIHGRIVRVILDNDPDYYYEGRASVQWTNVQSWKLRCVITVDASPYKLATTETLINLSNADLVSTRLSIPATRWRDLSREAGIPYPIRHTLQFGTQTYPTGRFRGYDLVEAVFEGNEAGKTVDFMITDSSGHTWTNSTNVMSRTVGGVVEYCAFLSLQNARDMGGISVQNVTKLELATSSSSANTDRLGYIRAVNLIVTTSHAEARITTDMPSTPFVRIYTGASSGVYVMINDTGYLSTELPAWGADSRLRLKRGENIIVMRPRDTAQTNSLIVNAKVGSL